MRFCEIEIQQCWELEVGIDVPEAGQTDGRERCQTSSV